MATYYADTSTGGTGATSDTWANAMSTLSEITTSSTLGPSANLSLVAGDLIFCRHGTAGTGQVFDENNASASITFSFPTTDHTNPVLVFGVDDSTTAEPPTDTDLLAAGVYARLRTTVAGGDLTFAGSSVLHNFRITTQDNISLGTTDGHVCSINDGQIDGSDNILVGSGFDGAHHIWRDVWVNWSDTGGLFQPPTFGTWDWCGGGYLAGSASVEIDASTVGNVVIRFEDLDLTAYTDSAALFDYGHHITVRNCLINANTVLSPTNVNNAASRSLWMGCQSDASGVNAPSIQAHLSTVFGEVTSSEAYTLAASDGTTSYSYKMVPSGTRNFDGVDGLKSLEIHVPVTTSDTQILINVMRKATAGAPALLNKENCFIRANEPANDTTMYDVVMSNEGPFKATPTTWSTNTEAWSGSPSNPTKQELTLAISPEHDETMQVWVVYAGDSETGEALDLYIDPKAVVT